jgi:hypothetical protein
MFSFIHGNRKKVKRDKMNKKTYKNENQIMVDEEDDDNDSLGSALSDYNGVFYGLFSD